MNKLLWIDKYLNYSILAVYKKLKPVSRQALTNFVNLKSNTIMKKPRCKYTDFSIPVKICSAKLCFSTYNKNKKAPFF